MEKLKKEMQVLKDNFDALLYYDKKKLDREMKEWTAKKYLIGELLKDNVSLNKIMRYTQLTKEEVKEIIKEIEADI